MQNLQNKIIKLSLALALFFLSSLSFADPIWIDVRTPKEYAKDHIEGDMNIPIATINAESLAELFGKDAEINLYCRSGGRAGKAKKLLINSGFSNINNVGGIDDVRKLREIAKQNSSR